MDATDWPTPLCDAECRPWQCEHHGSVYVLAATAQLKVIAADFVEDPDEYNAIMAGAKRRSESASFRAAIDTALAWRKGITELAIVHGHIVNDMLKKTTAELEALKEKEPK